MNLSQTLASFYAPCLYFEHSTTIQKDPRKRATLLYKVNLAWEQASQALNSARVPFLFSSDFKTRSQFLSFHSKILDICNRQLKQQRENSEKKPLEDIEKEDIDLLEKVYQSVQVWDETTKTRIFSCVEYFLRKKEYAIALKIAAFLPIETIQNIIDTEMGIFLRKSYFKDAICFFNTIFHFPTYYFWDPTPLVDAIISKRGSEKAFSLLAKFSKSRFKTQGYQKLVDLCCEIYEFEKIQKILSSTKIQAPPILGRLFYHLYKRLPDSFSANTKIYSRKPHSLAVVAAAKMFIEEKDYKSAVNIALKSKNSHSSLHTLCEYVAVRVSFCEDCLIDFLELFPEDAYPQRRGVTKRLLQLLNARGLFPSTQKIKEWENREIQKRVSRLAREKANPPKESSSEREPLFEEVEKVIEKKGEVSR